MKTIGLIGGTTWLSTVEYYRLLNQLVNRRLGGIHSAKVLLYSVEFAGVSLLQKEDRWEELTEVYIDIARKLQTAGADCLLLGANTMHCMAEGIQSAIDIPLIHIGEATALEVKRRGVKRVGLMGTKYTMEMDFYKKKLAAQKIEQLLPLDDEREFIHSTIYNELAKGVFRDETKLQFKTIIRNLVNRGAEGVILGCTEIPLLIKQADSSVPVFDTTEIHVNAAVEFALHPEPTFSVGDRSAHSNS
ncbi:MAG: aspartate/glutamate racemase family protein [Ignavibacteriae bacterium]|nr:aspartate/glutamate racemase family protein [Ignavibacteriota bacterium]